MGGQYGYGDIISLGKYGRVEFHALFHDPLKCDSSGWQGVVFATIYHPRILLHDSRGRGGSPLSSLSVSSTSVDTRCLLSYFSAAQMALPSRLSLRLYLPGSHLVETLLSTSLHVSVDIHGLWRAARLSGFGTVRRNSAKILSIRVLV